MSINFIRNSKYTNSGIEHDTVLLLSLFFSSSFQKSHFSFSIRLVVVSLSILLYAYHFPFCLNSNFLFYHCNVNEYNNSTISMDFYFLRGQANSVFFLFTYFVQIVNRISIFLWKYHHFILFHGFFFVVVELEKYLSNNVPHNYVNVSQTNVILFLTFFNSKCNIAKFYLFFTFVRIHVTKLPFPLFGYFKSNREK